ncbi:MAG: translation initiation factor IF-5A [Candidatus Micrarchaeota archaeon]|nr:translation initiation factor IF-5A [Candidatus Micrarchaeota archaeon]
MAEDEIQFVTMKEMRTGKYILIDGVPCRIVDIETSSPGKHGSAKMRVTAIGIFDGSKKTLLKPADADAEAPVIKKKKAQVVSINGPNVQLMDSETYEVFELPITEEFQGKLNPGAEVEILEAMGKRALSRMLTSG